MNSTKKQFFIVGVVLATFLLVVTTSSDELLTQDLNQVNKIHIKLYENRKEAELTAENHYEIISNIYKRTKSTSVKTYSTNEKGQYSTPRFEITFNYKDGQTDEIKATETGEFIYRQLPGSRWIGGSNKTLLSELGKIVNSD